MLLDEATHVGTSHKYYLAYPRPEDPFNSTLAQQNRILVPTNTLARVNKTMSDSDQNLPSEAAIATKLRDIVIAIHKSGNTDDLTVKRVRARAEKELGLDDGFFKTNPVWKQKSQEQIVEAVEKYCDADPSPQPTPKKAASNPKTKPAEKKTKAATASARGVKRKAAPAKKPAKRQKPSSDDDSEPELSEPPAEISAEESDSPKKPVRRGKQIVTEDSDEDNDDVSKAAPDPSVPATDEESGVERVAPEKKAKTEAVDSDSDLSSVIDEEPVKKQRKKKDSAPAAKKASKPKATQAKTADDPDQAKIKELQGWLVKCGIRKVWSRDPELSKCNTAKEKIVVLRNMLKDVGMEGKFSVEKAAKIKEQREFAKDLEAIQEGEMAWGKTSEVTSTGRPSRRAAARPVPVQKIVLEEDSEEDTEGGGGADESSEDDDVHPDSDEESEGKDDDSGADDSD
ncbi:hypothetical protein IAQ61_004764 [Plenodomus lingam]|uniref:uncharacterized protein n=1 Tax=Leptosphaeria maculans TaxID=5022 RepID=UPI0033230846|nr:hypothetical protein IAQ61_004764 [Plenodomus lingam]